MTRFDEASALPAHYDQDQSAGPPSMAALIGQLHGLISAADDLPDPATEEGIATREFFTNNWARARDGILSRTSRFRVQPIPGPGPRIFDFETDLPYKRKRRDGSVELAPGPIRGTIHYRANLMSPEPGRSSIAVSLDPTLGFYHSNYSRTHGFLCLGHLPDGPYPLEPLIEHIYGILSYQNRDSNDPADIEAVRYFSTDPDSLVGLGNVPPLY